MKLLRFLTIGIVLGAWIAAGSAASSSSAKKAVKRPFVCGDIPARYDSAKPFRTFAKAYAVLDSPNFNAFKESAFSSFGRAFAHPVPQRKLADQLAIYGYDFIGTYRGYLLFYRRAEGWYQAGSLPTLTAPNGEALPAIQLPQDLNPMWPAPGLLVSESPFIGAIVLPQQIIAIPCMQ